MRTANNRGAGTTSEHHYDRASSGRKEVEVTEKKVSKAACVIQFEPELTNPDERPLLAACTTADGGQADHIVLDFSRVEKMNGLGASMLAKLENHARRQGQQTTAYGLRSDFQRVLQMTELDQDIREYDSSADGSLSDVSLPALSDLPKPRGLESWAPPVQKLRAPPLPSKAWNRNVTGRRAVGPVKGFGQLWQKTYRLKVSDPSVTPEQAILALKQNFPSFQPSYNRFYPSPKGILPGEIVAIDSSTPGGPVSTGVLILYADDRSFTFATPQGHPESGWVSFSAYESQGNTVVQILGLARANDPIFEAAFRLVGSKMQVKTWKHLLTSLAAYLGVPPQITVEPTCIDRKMQWSEAKNVWYNAQIRTLLYAPVRWARQPFRRKRD
jgi:anti-anti-sigma regulatory factor